MSEELEITLPQCAADYIDLVVKKMGYRRKVRVEVREELTGHFTDALHGITDERQRVEKAMVLIAEFGDPKTLATLIRRGKKRCRPLWLKALLRTCQAAGIALLVFIVYIVWFLSGRPYISVDYVAELNKTVRPTVDESLNAAPYYDRAASLITPEPDSMPTPWLGEAITPAQLAAEREWVASNAAAIAEIHKGNEKPYCWRTYTTSDGTLMGVTLPEVSAEITLAYLLTWRAWLDAEDGDFEGAFGEVRQSYLLGRHMENKSVVAEQAVAARVKSRAAGVARAIIAMPGVQPDLLAKFQADYEKLLTASDFRMHCEGEGMFIKDVIQRTFTKSGRLSPLAMVGFLRSVESGSGSHQEEWNVGQVLVSSYMLLTHPDKETTLKQAIGFYDRAQQFADATPYRARTYAKTFSEYQNQLLGVNKLPAVALPAIESWIVKSWRNYADCHAFLAQIAAERYRRDKGAYPENLAELKQAGYLKDLPMDPWSDRSLVYRKTADGYTLYSVGEDFIDDGGKPQPQDRRNRQRQKVGWDFVFWPMPKDGGGKK